MKCEYCGELQPNESNTGRCEYCGGKIERREPEYVNVGTVLGAMIFAKAEDEERVKRGLGMLRSLGSIM